MIAFTRGDRSTRAEAAEERGSEEQVAFVVVGSRRSSPRAGLL
jgi:hypothetical protein